MALAAQGFATPRPDGRVDVRHFRRVLSACGAIQVDSVNVVVRSHYLPFFSRLGAYERRKLDAFVATTGEVFEYWGHAASVMPLGRYPLLRFRMRATRPWGRVQALLDEQPGYVEDVYREVEHSGPLTVSGLSDSGTRTGPWWGYGKGKTALEWLFATGRIGATRDGNFRRVYDLPHRMYPPAVLEAPGPDQDDAYRELLVLAAAHLGVGTAADLADYYRLRILHARRIVRELVRAGRLHEVDVGDWSQPAYAHPEARLPRRVHGCTLLSPFDSLIWRRDRIERLFGFRYRVEIYVPRPKRQYGYYVLPFLLDGHLVARVDLKADRPRGVLRVRTAHVEPGSNSREVAHRLASELNEMAEWLGLGEVAVDADGQLASDLLREIHA
jgi:uncharacterized protein YcaQ